VYYYSLRMGSHPPGTSLTDSRKAAESVNPSKDLVLDLKANADGESVRGETRRGQNAQPPNRPSSAMKPGSIIESDQNWNPPVMQVKSGTSAIVNCSNSRAQ
jgi:hypothetical protein